MNAKAFLSWPLLLVASAALGQSLIKDVSSVRGGKVTPLRFDTFDSRSNLRLTWDAETLRKRMNELATAQSLSAEIREAADISQIASDGLEALEQAKPLLDNGRVTPEAARVLQPVVNRARTLRGYEDRLNSALLGGVRQASLSGAEPIISGLAAVFEEIERIGAEVGSRATRKSTLASVNFWVGASVSRDFDPTRRRDVPFLSPLTEDDRKNLAAVQAFAEKYAGTPSAFLRGRVESLRAEIKKLGEELEQSARMDASEAVTRLNALIDALRGVVDEGATSVSNLKLAISDFRTELLAVADVLKSISENLKSATDTRAQALETLGSFDSVLGRQIALFDSVSRLETRLKAVEVVFKKVTDDAGAGAADAIRLFNEFVKASEAHIKEGFTRLETTLKGSLKTLVSSMGLAEDMRVIANFVEKGDLEKGYQDINFVGDGGKRLDLNAGDKVTIGIKISMAAEPPADFEESRDLYAYPSGATSDRLFPIVFAQRDDLDSSGNRRRGWRFSPTYMDAVKFYRPGASHATNKWFTPGFGIAISALDQNGDDAYELGLGAGITLLDDRLVGGVGFNLQRNRMYAFFGIRLRLGDLGIKG